jgi:hypothetical protein
VAPGSPAAELELSAVELGLTGVELGLPAMALEAAVSPAGVLIGATLCVGGAVGAGAMCAQAAMRSRARAAEPSLPRPRIDVVLQFI